MKNRHLIKQGAAAVALAVILGFPAANAAEVYLQAVEFQKSIPYGSGVGVTPNYSATIVNSSFEDPDCSLPGCVIDAVRGNYFAGSVSGWVATGSAGVFRPNAPIIVPTDGAQVGWSNGGELSQLVAEELAPNTTYTLSVDVGSRTDTNINTYIIGLYANGVLLAEDNNSQVPPPGGWVTSTVTYTSGAVVTPGQALEIRLDGNGAQEEFDNVRLDVVSNAANVTMWGYSECTDDTFSNCSAASSPGPQINVPAGDVDGLIVTLRNTLPEATSLMIAGQRPAIVTVNGAPTTALGRTPDNRLRSFAPEIPGAVAAPATNIAVANAGFEDPVLANGGFNSAVIGWTGTGGGTFNPTATQLPGEASEGSNTHFSNGGTFSQTLGDNLVQGTYQLSVDVGDRADTGFPGYQVQLGVDNGGFVLLAEDNSSQTPSTGFLTSTVTYNAAAGDPLLGLPLIIRLVGNGVQVNFDNVRLSVSGGAGTVSTGTYTWSQSDLRSGSYLYQSGSHVQLQVQMGLYGAMVQDAEGCNDPNCAYPDVSYDAQQVLVFSEIDPALHDPVPTPANATVTGYRPQFFLINGEVFDGTLPPALASAGDDLLLRMISASLDNHSIQLLNGHFEVLGEDGRRSPTSKMIYNALLPAAKSLDVMFTPGSAGTYSLYDRRLRLMNGPVDGGGMFYPIVIN